MTGIKTRIALAVGLALLLALGAVGCATTSQEAKARRLNTDEAEKLLGYQRARQGNPEAQADPEADPKALEARGDGLALSGSWEAALYQYNRALTLADPEQRIRLLGKAAQIHLKARNFPQAEALFETIIKDDPANAQAWQGLGLARLSLGDPQSAAETLTRALALRPDLWKSANALGIIHNHRREPRKALALFSQALKHAPQSAEIYNNRGLAYLSNHQKALAEADFNRALSLKPDFELAHNNLALLMAKEGRYGAAFSAFRRGSGQAQAHNNLGCWLAWQGDDQKAAEHFGQALKDMPRYYPLAGTHLEQLKVKDGGDRPLGEAGSLSMSRPQSAIRVEDRVKVSFENPVIPTVERRPRPQVAAAPEPAPVVAPTVQAPKPAGKAKLEPVIEDAAAVAPKPGLSEGAVLTSPRPALRPVAKSEPLPAPERPQAPEPVAAAPAAQPVGPQTKAQAQHLAPRLMPGPDLGFSAGPVVSVQKSASAKAAEEPLVRLKAKPAGHPGVWHGTIPPQVRKQDLPQIARDEARPGLP